jgi:hypothetical protein
MRQASWQIYGEYHRCWQYHRLLTESTFTQNTNAGGLSAVPPKIKIEIPYCAIKQGYVEFSAPKMSAGVPNSKSGV